MSSSPPPASRSSAPPRSSEDAATSSDSSEELSASSDLVQPLPRAEDDSRDPSPASSGGAASPSLDKGKSRAADQDADAEDEDEKEEEERVKQAKLMERFQCGICYEVPEEPVVTPCGHLFCWGCMHEWLVVSSGRACPACKAALSVEKLIPIYSGDGEHADPRFKPLPPRPRPSSSTPSSTFRAPTARPGLCSLPTSSSSTFTFQAGVFPLPGLSFGYTWPPRDEGEERERLGLRLASAMADPHGAGRIAPAQDEWVRSVAQQAFLLLFFAVFLAMTFSG
ncbi:hypothetical protein JCM8097_007765 [Rhodosporidiobolus ruineniae]